jgi:hypothetical protein
MSEEKTYRSAGARVISDNMVVSFNLYFIRNVLGLLLLIGGIVYKYETRLRTLESTVITNQDELRKLVEHHIALEESKRVELEEKIMFYEKSLNINPLSWKRKKKK